MWFAIYNAYLGFFLKKHIIFHFDPSIYPPPPEHTQMFRPTNGWGFANFISREKALNYLDDNGALHIVCSMPSVIDHAVGEGGFAVCNIQCGLSEKKFRNLWDPFRLPPFRYAASPYPRQETPALTWKSCGLQHRRANSRMLSSSLRTARLAKKFSNSSTSLSNTPWFYWLFCLNITPHPNNYPAATAAASSQMINRKRYALYSHLLIICVERSNSASKCSLSNVSLFR